ncbi:unnamed protein product [Clavelina lepadiformis]|uniref:Uncharacterized protein n=1 Tax=Clavelina lepadiformis TaxID=159417 RepID=A0ABP0F241_CLALP
MVKSNDTKTIYVYDSFGKEPMEYILRIKKHFGYHCSCHVSACFINIIYAKSNSICKTIDHFFDTIKKQHLSGDTAAESVTNRRTL